MVRISEGPPRRSVHDLVLPVPEEDEVLLPEPSEERDPDSSSAGAPSARATCGFIRGRAMPR